MSVDRALAAIAVPVCEFSFGVEEVTLSTITSGFCAVEKVAHAASASRAITVSEGAFSTTACNRVLTVDEVALSSTAVGIGNTAAHGIAVDGNAHHKASQYRQDYFEHFVE